jgi:hypothetical protein
MHTLTHSIYLRSILILSCHVHLDLPSVLFPLDLYGKLMYAFVIYYACCMPRLSHQSLKKLV